MTYRLYKDEASDATLNAQRNLMGRTHYVDPDTLRFHKSRVLSARHTDGGLLFAIVTSDSLDWHNTKRGFRFVIFDLFGNTLGRTKLEDAFRRREQAEKAMWAELNKIDAKAVNREALAKHRNYLAIELAELERAIDKVETVKAA